MSTATAPSEIVESTITQGLASLREKAQAIVVRDQQGYIAAATLITEGKAYIKNVKARLGPGIDSAKTHLDFLKNQQASFVAPVEEIVKILDQKRITWAEEEKRAAKVEEDRRNAELRRQQQQKAEDERRAAEKEAAETRRARVAEINAMLDAKQIGKREAARLLKEAGAEEEAAKQTAAAQAEETKAAPPPVVKVVPSIPTVAGIKNQTFYFAAVSGEANENLLIDAFHDSTGERRTFLRQFISVNQQEVGAYARKTKNNAKVEADIPGCTTSSRG